ncbi:MAG: hypothetical protein AAB702_00480 [Patescibacteria group bacterium]
MGSNEKSILKTLLYADIFNFPLKKNQIWKFLISDKKVSKKSLFKNTLKLNKFVEFKNGYFFIKGKSKLINLRKKREKESLKKLLKAKAIINKISFIPTLKLIGISGALSMKNSDKNDDIDLFVISKKGFAWTTRFTLVLILILLRSYRHKNSQSFTDKICLNMIVDEDNIVFKKNNQNLYTAHEIVQLIPVLDRDSTYEKFIAKNSWVKKYLANSSIIKKSDVIKKENILDSLFINILKIIFLENILKIIQTRYMKKSITKEIIKKGFLAFHPFDYNAYVLKVYKKNLTSILILEGIDKKNGLLYHS